MEDRSVEPYRWQHRAWEPDPSRRFVAVAFMSFAGLAGLLFLRHPLFALIGVGVVFVSTAELFLPAKYSLDDKGAEQKIGFAVTAIRWSDVKRLIPQSDGVRLSPFERPHRLDAFRGVFLRYAGNEAAVLGKIRELWHGDADSVERGTDPGGEGRARGEGGASRPQEADGDASDPVP